MCWLATLTSLPACGQSKEPQVAGGIFASAGIEDFTNITGTAGGYVEVPRFQFRPGVEIREEGRTGQEKVFLVGPRVSYAAFGRDMYAMALFGRGQMLNSAGTQQISGLSSEVGIGFEKNLGPFVRWRMFELSAKFFNGESGATTLTGSTGFVLHFH
jgi:hypothetical protein